MSDVEIIRRAVELSREGRAYAYAEVVRAFGSTPQKAGAKALFASDGQMWGTLGGGCLEAECRRRAMDSLDGGSSMVFDLKLDDIQGWDDGLICGGRVQVLVNPAPTENVAAYEALLSAKATGESGALVTQLDGQGAALGRSEFVPASTLQLWLDEDKYSALKPLIEEGRPGMVSVDQGELYVEPIQNKPHLVIAGAGHIGQATAHLAALVGFDVTVIDDRPALASAEHIPEARQTICGDIPGEVAKVETDANTYVVIVTRGHRHDGTVLAAAVKKPAAFIGMIGSRRKGLLIRQGLIDEGLATEAELQRVCSPIGVDIGAESVQEIALSIVTQLVAVRRKRAWGAPALNYGLEDHGNRPRGGAVTADGAAEAAASVGG